MEIVSISLFKWCFIALFLLLGMFRAKLNFISKFAISCIILILNHLVVFDYLFVRLVIFGMSLFNIKFGRVKLKEQRAGVL